MRLTPCEHQQAADFVLVPALSISSTTKPSKGHLITARDAIHVPQAVPVKLPKPERPEAVEKVIAAHPIGLTQ
jgi:hypothetical protein